MRLGRQSEPLILQRPLGRCVTKVGSANPARESAFDGGLDQAGCNKCHGDRHVDVANAAFVPSGDALDSHLPGDDLIQPCAAPCDRFDQRGAAFKFNRPDVPSIAIGRDKDFLEPFVWRFGPRNQEGRNWVCCCDFIRIMTFRDLRV